MHAFLWNDGVHNVYRASLPDREDPVWLWELAPLRFSRDRDGWLTGPVSESELRTLRWLAIRSATTLHNIGRPALRLIHAWSQSRTAYWVTESVPASPLALNRPPITAQSAREHLERVGLLLESLHRHNKAHLGIGPHSLLIGPAGTLFVAAPGAVRQWLLDARILDSALYPELAPEQRDPLRGAGPASDWYGLAATLMPALIEGHTPAWPLPLIDALQMCLCPAPELRPQSFAALAAILRRDPAFVPEPKSLSDLDETRALLAAFRFAPRQCPACGDPMEDPKPLKAGRCPCCHTGRLRPRLVLRGICPDCRTGILRPLTYQPGSTKTAPCPACIHGIMTRRGRIKPVWTCRACQHTTTIATEPTPETRTLKCCTDCPAAFAPLPDGRLKSAHGAPTHPNPHDEDEFAELAAKLPPGSGDKMCNSCRASFVTGENRITLVAAESTDRALFASRSTLRCLSPEQMRWAAVGQTSLDRGLVCVSGDVEFDTVPGAASPIFRLVRAQHPLLGNHVAEQRSLDEWHRLANGLPLDESETAALDAAIDRALHNAYRSAELYCDGKSGHIIWEGPARFQATAKANPRSGLLKITRDSLTFRSLLYRQGAMLLSVTAIERSNDQIRLTVEGAEEPWTFEIAPIEMSTRLSSGKRKIKLDASDLVAHVQRALAVTQGDRRETRQSR